MNELVLLCTDGSYVRVSTSVVISALQAELENGSISPEMILGGADQSEAGHCYMLIFSDGETMCSATISLDKKIITGSVITEAKSLAGASENAFLIAATYLGYMTANEASS